MKTLSVKQAAAIIQPDTVIFWFRRDLRLEDNAGLYHALKSGSKVLCLFIFDTQILNELEDRSDLRVDFIHRSLNLLREKIADVKSSLMVLHGNPVKIFTKLQPKAVYANHDYEPYGRERDQEVRTILEKNGSALFTFKDQVIFEKDEVTKDNGEPYTVFTPYSKKWKVALRPNHVKPFPVEKYLHNFLHSKQLPFPSLKDIGFATTELEVPERVIKTSLIKSYHKTRDYPFLQGTSRLGVHLRFGTVSIRKLVRVALKSNSTWLNELIWREFYHMILWHFPHITNQAFKPAYDHISWRNDAGEFHAWCEGKTGYPVVDAGMRELNTTGFMHNRVRMIVASFLTKHLLIDWRWGEAYFAKKLLDYDRASNVGGWQWAAGSGCDAAPYFRVFNPVLQTEKFDANREYIKRWIPEINSESYPSPIVDHKVARDRAIKTFQKALRGLQH